ncbi:MAG: type II toxin-antitoxin system VapB family antitoxin [Spirosomaceae bacterium]|jgi:Arc/MetJ family transcription regulator|nr:type II toxin-antitoxin system VapB family antitoxin [Spirosomataceae bacterium]
MRTNVEIDEEKISAIRQLDDNLKTKKEIIDLALNELIGNLRRQRLRQMRGKGWEGNLEKMRVYDVPTL